LVLAKLTIKGSRGTITPTAGDAGCTDFAIGWVCIELDGAMGSEFPEINF